MSLPTSAPAAILFTDIEGSTRLWEQDGARMSGSLAEHDALARRVVADQGGEVIKMVGDGVYAVFGEPGAAVAAALALQQGLDAFAARGLLPLKARCGVHVGAVERRDNDVFGSAVNRGARIMGAAHGGQVLVSQSLVDALSAALPEGVSLRDLGAVRLRDLATPERLHQLMHASLREAFPALRSLEATPNNLPQQATSFIGRESDLVRARELLGTTRLLTLLGMGGMGKTRLSLQIAADVMDEFPDGVWFVDLAPVKDRDLVANEVAQVLGIAEEPGRPLLTTICSHMRSRRSLVILDNCEHLVSVCASVAHALLRGGEGVKIIATTREALRVPGEQTHPVLPLPLPDRQGPLADLPRSEAVQLFLERVRLLKPGFELTDADAPAMAELCQRLEGIPLAIELAAARMQTLGVAEINRRLKDRYKLLTGGSRVLLERQQTLRALVGWSYDLLQENERVFFDRLSVFAGGFDLAAAEAVCGADPLDRDDVLDLLSSLVEKSLVMVEERSGETRYRLLETLCDYGRERLIKRDDVAATAERHCMHFLDQAKAANRGLQGPEQAAWIRRIELDLDNLRAATALAVDGRVDPVLAVKFAVALQGFWTLRGYATEGRNVVRAALARAEVRAFDVAHAHALYVGGALAVSQGDHAEALRLLEECLDLRRHIGNPIDIAATLSTLAHVRLHAGDAARARAGEEEAVAIFRAERDRVGEAIGFLHLGEICMYVEDDANARTHIQQCLAIARQVSHREIECECERLLGELALAAGDAAGARERLVRSLSVAREAEDKRSEALAQWWMGRIDLTSGLLELAEDRLRSALRAFRSFRMNAEVLCCLEDQGALLAELGRVQKAVEIYGAVEASRRVLVVPRPPRTVPRFAAQIEGARALLPPAAFDAAWRAGESTLLEDVVERTLTEVLPEIVAA